MLRELAHILPLHHLAITEIIERFCRLVVMIDSEHVIDFMQHNTPNRPLAFRVERIDDNGVEINPRLLPKGRLWIRSLYVAGLERNTKSVQNAHLMTRL